MKWNKANPDKFKATQDRYRERNADAIRERAREYYAANREKVLRQRRESRLRMKAKRDE